MLDTSRNFPAEITEYINTYPAFADSRFGAMDNAFFYDVDMEHRLLNGPPAVIRYRDCIRREKPVPPFIMEEAREFLEWLEPIWCSWKNIESTGFDFGTDVSKCYLDDDLPEI